MGDMRRIMWCGVGLSVLIGMIIPSASWAQVAKGKKEKAAKVETEIEEITVTAQKREEPLQETPISITALSSETIEEKQIANVADVGSVAPNLHIHSNSGGKSGVTISMRGVSTTDPIITLQPTVGLYVDGVYIAKSGGANLDLSDLERIEVLRGPQGTLYGRNTTGGAVNFIVKKPSDQRSITLRTEVGNYDEFLGQVIVNVPILGKNGFAEMPGLGQLNLRQNINYRSRDGLFRNKGSTGPSDFVNFDREFSDTAIRWQPNKDLTVDYSFQYHRHRENPTSSQLSYVDPGSPAAGFGLQKYIQKGRVDAIYNNALLDANTNPLKPQPLPLHPQMNHGNGRIHSLTAEYHIGEVGRLGDLTVKSVAVFRNFFQQEDQDLDGSDVHAGDFQLYDSVEHWSEELQLIGTLPRIKYVLGGYYYGEHGKERSDQVILGGGTNLGYSDFFKSRSYAPYGQVTWTPPILGDKLSLTAGIRYTQEQVHHEKYFRCVAILTPAGPGGSYINICNIGFGFDNYYSGRGKAFGGTDAISPMGNVAYQWTDDVMTYAKVSRGFKSGGFNGRATSPESFAQPFNPETLTSYEAGFKTQWLDNRLRANGSMFFSQYKDMQVSVFRASPTGGAVSTLQNAAKADIWGAEFEMVAIPVRGLEAMFQYGFVDPTYKEFEDQVPDPNNPGKTISVDVSDQRKFVSTPKNTFTVGLTYTAPPMTAGTFSAHIETYFQDATQFIVATRGVNDMGNYALVNGRLQLAGIPLQKGSLDIALYGRNLFDRKYRLFGVDFGPSLGWAINQYGDPRTFGLQLAYNFTAGEAAPPPPAPVAQAAPPPPPAKKKIVLRSVHFDFDKATLKADAKPILDEAVQVLKQEGSVDIVVEGHTDSVGTDQYNLGLSRRRAETVRTYLVDHGIARSRITAEGMGESKPVASNDTADGRAQNRRVELHVK